MPYIVSVSELYIIQHRTATVYHLINNVRGTHSTVVTFGVCSMRAAAAAAAAATSYLQVACDAFRSRVLRGVHVALKSKATALQISASFLMIAV